MEQELITIQELDYRKLLFKTLQNENNNFSLFLPDHLCTVWDHEEHYLLLENKEAHSDASGFKRPAFKTLDENCDLRLTARKKRYSLFKQIRRWLRKDSIIVISEGKLLLVDYPFNGTKSELIIDLVQNELNKSN